MDNQLENGSNMTKMEMSSIFKLANKELELDAEMEASVMLQDVVLALGMVVWHSGFINR